MKTTFIRTLVSIILVMTSYHVQADKYKVLYVNSANIWIGDNLARKDLIFDDHLTIRWNSDKDALKVLNLTNHKVSVIPAAMCKKRFAKSIYDLYFSRKHLSTRDVSIAANTNDSVFYLLDTLRLGAERNNGRSILTKIVLTCGRDTISSEIQRDNTTNEYILTREILGGKDLSSNCIANIIETDIDKNWTYFVYLNMPIAVLPLNTKK